VKASIAVPAYEMKGQGSAFLRTLLSSVHAQDFKEIEVVVSDDSTDDEIERLCKEASEFLNLRYLRHKGQKRSSSNVNNAILNSTGDVVKVLFQDDFLFDKRSMTWVMESHETGSKWSLSSCVHTYDGSRFFRHHVPSFHPKGYLGENLAGSPSGLSFTRECDELFDENLVWLMDCELYHRLYLKCGNPHIIPHPAVANRLWEGQVTNQVDEAVKTHELSYVWRKFNA
jgi:glycosyltransferase involved in cell wall biosynthesis